jgi:hypothetical protein
MNHTILERARCMLSNAGLWDKHNLWAETAATACYLINRSPNSAVDFKIPEEVWSGKPVDYSNLRIFGCPAYAHVNNGKVVPRAQKCTFVGYGSGVKGYRLLCADSNKVIVSRDVTFDESTFSSLGDASGSDSSSTTTPETTVENLEVDLPVNVDSDYAGDLDTRHSISDYIFSLCGSAVSWKASLQSVVALSTTEAEYVASTEGVKEAICMRGLISELGVPQDALKVYCDSHSAICLTKNGMFQFKTKHVDIKYQFIRDVVPEGKIIVVKVHTDENPADMLTKPLSNTKFKHCLDLVSIHGAWHLSGVWETVL